MTPGGRPTSELLGGVAGSTMFQSTPEAEAIDQWFENLQNYEATLVRCSPFFFTGVKALISPFVTLIGRNGGCVA